MRKVVVAALFAIVTTTATADLEHLKTLFDQGRFQDAYQLSELMMDDYSGEPLFDFYYAVAAVETNHPSEAIFPLERVLLAEPKNHRVRLELGRALFIMGDLEAAQEQFELVKNDNPPAGVLENISLFEEAITRQESQIKPTINYYASVAVGYDDNVNSATFNDHVDIPIFGKVTLSGDAVAIPDGFMQYDGGLQYTYPVSKVRSYYLGASISELSHFTEKDFDLTTGTIRGGMLQVINNQNIRIPIEVQKIRLDNSDFRESWTVGGEWNLNCKPTEQYTAYVQAGQLSFPHDDSQDTNMGLFGGGWVHHIVLNKVLANINGYYGQEHSRHEGGEHNSKNFGGFQTGIQWLPLPKHYFLANVGLQDSKYGADDPIFGIVRKDTNLSLSGMYQWRFNKSFSLYTLVSFTYNDSNIELYDHNGLQGSVGVRYEGMKLV